MSNDECLKNDEIRMTKSRFVLRHLCFIRHSSFDITKLPPCLCGEKQ